MTSEPPSERLAAWRAGRGFSLKEAGKLFGVAAPTVLAYEKGEKRPSRGARRNLVEAVTGIPSEDWATAEERALEARARAAQADVPQPPAPTTPPTPTRTRKPRASKRTQLPGPVKARTPKRAPKAEHAQAVG